MTSAFPLNAERGKALGINVMAVYAGLSVGPPLGGYMADHFGWPWIFLVNLPIGLAIFLGGWLLLPAVEGEPGRRMDLLGAALLARFLTSAGAADLRAAVGLAGSVHAGAAGRGAGAGPVPGRELHLGAAPGPGPAAPEPALASANGAALLNYWPCSPSAC